MTGHHIGYNMFASAGGEPRRRDANEPAELPGRQRSGTKSPTRLCFKYTIPGYHDV